VARTILIGNPENRRVVSFREAVLTRDGDTVEVVSYIDLLRGDSALSDLAAGPAIVRQDSAGESFEVDKALLTLGYDRALAAGASTIAPAAIAELEFDRGRIICPRQLHCGFVELLAKIQTIYDDRPDWSILQPISGIEFLFDKRLTSRRWHSEGIPVPEPLDDIASYDDLRSLAQTRGIREIYIKVSCSSSASCLAVYSHREARDFITTTIECADTGWYNSLKIRRYSEPSRVAEIVNYLLREGAQVEVGVPKARLRGAPFDIRFVVIGGEALFAVVRQNRHGITNLHLGGWRGDWDALASTVPAEQLDAARADAVRAAETSGCFVVGVDVLLERSGAGHRVIEGNAFGDLLPGLSHDGLTVYEQVIRRATAQFAG